MKELPIGHVRYVNICNMAPRLLGQTSIFGVVFFESKSLLGIERQKKLSKFTIFTRKPRSHVRILGTFSNDDENVNVTDRKSGKRTLMLPRMPNQPFAPSAVENVSMFYLFSNFCSGTLGISSI